MDPTRPTTADRLLGLQLEHLRLMRELKHLDQQIREEQQELAHLEGRLAWLESTQAEAT